MTKEEIQEIIKEYIKDNISINTELLDEYIIITLKLSDEVISYEYLPKDY